MKKPHSGFVLIQPGQTGKATEMNVDKFRKSRIRHVLSAKIKKIK